MAENFKPGDVVRLKSSGPRMTVAQVDGKRAWCEWFVGQENKRAVFEYAVLVLAEKDAGGGRD